MPIRQPFFIRTKCPSQCLHTTQSTYTIFFCTYICDIVSTHDGSGGHNFRVYASLWSGWPSSTDVMSSGHRKSSGRKVQGSKRTGELVRTFRETTNSPPYPLLLSITKRAFFKRASSKRSGAVGSLCGGTQHAERANNSPPFWPVSFWRFRTPQPHRIHPGTSVLASVILYTLCRCLDAPHNSTTNLMLHPHPVWRTVECAGNARWTQRQHHIRWGRPINQSMSVTDM